MVKISKDKLKTFFKEKKGKRYLLLFLYYQDEYFSKCPLPAELIAEEISSDLGTEISSRSVYYIKEYYEHSADRKSGNQHKELEKPETPQQESKAGKKKKEWVFSDPEPSGSEMREAFADILKTNEKEQE